jgi:hypothetical protein
VNIRHLTTLERSASWLDELIELTRPRGPLYGLDEQGNALVIDVTRKAKALKTSLKKLRDRIENPEPPSAA